MPRISWIEGRATTPGATETIVAAVKTDLREVVVLTRSRYVVERRRDLGRNWNSNLLGKPRPWEVCLSHAEKSP